MADDSRNADVGARYAQALFDLAEAQGSVDAVEKDLTSLADLCVESSELRRLIASPTFSAAQKGRALGAVAERADLSDLSRKFLGVLAQNARVSALPAITLAFKALAAEKRGVVAAEVTSAVALSPAQTEGLVAALRQALGKTPELTARIDPALLGGLKVRVGSKLFDSSLKTRLDQLKFALKRA